MPKKSNKDSGVWDLGDVAEKQADAAQWGLVGAKAYKGYSQTQKTLPAGVYSITMDRNDDRPIYIRRDINSDSIIELDEPLTRTMIEEIDIFWGKHQLFADLGFLHRRGYLLYGPQGTGKSSVVKRVVADVVRKGGLVFLCDNPKFLNAALVTLRQTEPERALVCVYEDVDAIIAKYGDDELLSVLDGANMIDHVLNVATTNYPERLDRRIVCRPRRFDRVIKVGLPTEAVRRKFLVGQKLKITKKELERIIKETEGLSMAGLSEVVISVYCLGNSLSSTLVILRAMEKNPPSSSEFDADSPIGFAADFGKGSKGDDDNDEDDDDD